MIRSSPADYYLKYLCTHPEGYKNDQIRRLVKLQGLDFLGMEHLQNLRSECTPPTPFYPEDKLHHSSMRFLTKERIYGLYHPDGDTLIAIKLLDNPKAKEVVESMLAAGAEPVLIVHSLKRLQFQATSRAVELYQHFYFNTKLLDSTELRAVLLMRSQIDVDPMDTDASRYRTAYEKVSKSNVHMLAQSSPLSPFSRILNMMQVGIMPTGVQIAKLATIARMAAVVRTAENSLLGRAERARDFALTGKIMNELIESVGDASGDLQKSMMGVALDTEASAVPSLEQLTQGNYTVELLPERVGEDSEVEAASE
jgi:hypothetical protein